MYLGRCFLTESIGRLGPAKASAFQVSSLLFTAVIAWLGPRTILGCALTLAGIAVVVLF